MRSNPARGARLLHLFLLLSAPGAGADPLLVVSEPTPLGAGLFAWSLDLDANDGENASLAVAVTVNGPIHQVPLTNATAMSAIGSSMDRASDLDLAIALDAAYAATTDRDSYFDDTVLAFDIPPFEGVAGGSEGSTIFQFSAATTPGEAVDSASLVRIVGSSGIDVEVAVGRLGDDYLLSTTLVPEPHFTLGAAIALLTLVVRRRPWAPRGLGERAQTQCNRASAQARRD